MKMNNATNLIEDLHLFEHNITDEPMYTNYEFMTL